MLAENERVTIKMALGHIAEACGKLFELQSNEGKTLAFMSDSLLKYGQLIYRGHDILIATGDYDKYEYDNFIKEKKHLEVIE